MNYKIVVTFLFPDGTEEYLLWEPLMYGDMIDKGVDFHTLFFDTSKNGLNTSPLEVHLDLYLDPTIQEITQNWGDKQVIRQLLIGRRICPLLSL